MSIYGALGHKISVLEKHVEHLQHENVIAREALVELLTAFEVLAKRDPSLREKYAHVEEAARKVLEETKH